MRDRFETFLLKIGKHNCRILVGILFLAVISGALVYRKAAMISGEKEEAMPTQEMTDGGSDQDTADEPELPEDEETAAVSAAAQAVQYGEGFSEEELAQILTEEAEIMPGTYPIMGTSSITVQQMIDYFLTSGEDYPSEELAKGGASDIEEFCRIFYEEALWEGVRPEVAFAQTMKETGWLQYGGDASITQYNFAGLGTTGGGVPGESYPDVRTGVRAQVQHLKAYATEETLNGVCVDTRYDYVLKGSAPYVEWLGKNENPEGYGWATGTGYGYDIVEMIHQMRES